MLTIDKTQLIKKAIDIYACDMICPNLEYHMEFYKTMQNIHASKSDADIISQYRYLKFIRNHNRHLRYELEQPRDEDMYTVLESIHIDDPDLLTSLRTYVSSERVYAYLQFMYTCLRDGTEWHHMLLVTKHLLCLKPKELFSQGNTNLDVTSLLFMLMLNLTTTNVDITKYVKISRELIFFKSNKKEVTTQRLGILFTTMHVVFEKQIDKRLLEKPCKYEVSDHTYLFVVCERDDEMINQVKRDRRKCNVEKAYASKKDIILSDVAVLQKRDMAEIVKMCD